MKKLIIFLTTIVCCLTSATAVYAAEYGEQFPNYLKYSGGGYIEVQSSAGSGTIIVPNQYKTNTFGFDNRGYNIFNCSSSTVTGRFITTNGTEYTCRFQGFSSAEIRPLNANAQTQYVALTVNQILNTNISFMDNTEQGRDNVPSRYEFSYIERFNIGFNIVCTMFVCFFLLILIFKRGY